MNLRVSRSSLVARCAALGCGLLWACGSSAPPPLVGASGGTGTVGAGGSGTSGSGAIGQQGAYGGPCRADNTCDASLSCYAGYCIQLGGVGGSGAVKQGSLAGACYANNTCDAGLVCNTGLCIPDVSVGTGGVAQGGGSAQGGSGQGGGVAQGGSGHAGSSQGGTTAQGGSAQGGSVGAGGVGGTTAIVSVDGWIAPGSNTVGIVGPWFVFKDTYSTINVSPAGGIDFTGSGSQVCVSGVVSQLDTYGPTVAFNFNQPDTTTGSWTPSTHGVTGFSFSVGGTLPSAMQISYISAGGTNEYCAILYPPSAGTNTILFSSTRLTCWTTGGAFGSPANSLESMHFQLPVNYFADGQSYNFCITNLKAVTG